MKFILVTNNSLVSEKYLKKENSKNLSEIVFLDGESYLSVLEKVRDYVHVGHELLTHPLSGSIKPYETPYKSICISARPVSEMYKNSSSTTHMESLMIIEDSITTTKKFLNDYKKRNYTDRHHHEFKIIDLSIIDSGVESINSGV